MTASRYIIRFLKEKNVRTVFAYPGANVLTLYSELCRSGIRVVLTRHEQGAIHAAAGYAKAVGVTGVCIATSGPGATNLVTGIADAYLDSAPVLIITGQVPSRFIGRDAFQEADIMGITIPVTKHNYLIRQEDELPRSLEEAWRVASAPRQGPVLADITSELFSSEIPQGAESFECVLPRKRHNAYPASAAKEKIKLSFRKSFRPLLLAGGGVALDASSGALCAFSEKSGIPIVTTMMGQAVAHTDSASFLGMAGMHGVARANRALSQCDLLIAVGCRFSDRTVGDFDSFSRSRTIIHCDIDPAEINKNVAADIPVVCTAGEFLTSLSGIADEINHDGDTLKSRFKPWRDEVISSGDSKPDASLAPFESEDSEADAPLYRAVGEYQKSHPGSFIVTDVGTIQTKAARMISVTRERSFITSGGLGAMGFGLPAAIGASFAAADCRKADPDSRIILICGDGGFQMTMQELGIVKSAPVPVKIIIVNNKSLKMVSVIPGGEGGLYDLSDNPDFTEIAAAYSIPASAVYASEGDIGKAVSMFLSDGTSSLLEIKI